MFNNLDKIGNNHIQDDLRLQPASIVLATESTK